MVTRSLEAQSHSSQRILKPSIPPITHLSPEGYKSDHLVFGSPATQIPVNPKAWHPTPVIILSQMNEPRFDAVLTHLIFEKLARRRLPPELSRSSAPKDIHFVSGVTLSAKYYRQITSGKSKNQMVHTANPAEGPPIDQCFLNLLSFSSHRQNSNFLEQVCLKLNSTSEIAF